ncbi:MAG: hypothetical protein GXP31_10885 [Kiritimatiellaeota bacterium]|nr:hypothetical protein [Kiritimatiellota bacterium]
MKTLVNTIAVLFLQTCSWFPAWADGAGSFPENDGLRLRCDAAGRITIEDKASGLVWTESLPKRFAGWPRGGPRLGGPMPSVPAADPAFRITAVDSGRDRIVLTAEWFVPLTIVWALADERTVSVEIAAASPQRPLGEGPKGFEHPRKLGYPAGLYSSAARYLAVPEDEGCLYETAVTDFETDHVRFLQKRCEKLSMPWWGVTDLEAGVMTLVETPYHAGYQLAVSDTPDGERSLPVCLWRLTAKQDFGYTRKLTYRFFEHGGYVAMAKYFRRRMIAAGRFVTLAEKARRNPEVRKLRGAMDMYVFHNLKRNPTGPITADQIQSLYDKGYKRLLLEVFQNTNPVPADVYTPEAIRRGKALGYLLGTYHLYSWVYTYRRGKPIPNLAKARTLCIQESPDGFIWRPSAWGRHGYYCPRVLANVLGPVARREAAYGFTAFFTDTTTAGGSVRACYNPDHPMKKTEAPAALNRALDSVTGAGLVVGSERGAWWAAPHCDYFTGIETLIAYQGGKYKISKKGSFQSGLYAKDLPGYSKYMVGYNYGAANRIPLFQLVYHDSVFCTRRWNDHHSRDPNLWRLNDLLCILYGVAPIVTFSTDDGPYIFDESYAPFHERYMRTYREVCGWHEQIGFEELKSHRFLTPDRLVQESVFASGRRVVVNFRDKPYPLSENESIPAMGYRIRAAEN